MKKLLILCLRICSSDIGPWCRLDFLRRILNWSQNSEFSQKIRIRNLTLDLDESLHIVTCIWCRLGSLDRSGNVGQHHRHAWPPSRRHAYPLHCRHTCAVSLHHRPPAHSTVCMPAHSHVGTPAHNIFLRGGSLLFNLFVNLCRFNLYISLQNLERLRIAVLLLFYFYLSFLKFNFLMLP